MKSSLLLLLMVGFPAFGKSSILMQTKKNIVEYDYYKHGPVRYNEIGECVNVAKIIQF